VRHASAALALVGVNLAVVAPFWSSPPALGPVRGETVRVLVLNLDVGNDRYDDVARLLRDVRPDVIGLSELSPVWARELAPVLVSYPHRALATEDGAYGIGLYGRVPLDAEIRHFPADGPPSAVGVLEIDGEPVTLVLTHVHTPFAGDIHGRQFDALAAARADLGQHVAICGDFNAVPWSAPFRELVEAGGFTEAMRGGLVEYSWPTWNPLLAVPIDNCLVRAGLALRSAEPGPDIGSDHFPIVVELGLPAEAGSPAAAGNP
jgi:endonuclease/exonuclease/phosphatase (EEP) superfamily protein YafD